MQGGFPKHVWSVVADEELFAAVREVALQVVEKLAVEWGTRRYILAYRYSHGVLWCGGMRPRCTHTKDVESEGAVEGVVRGRCV